MGMTPSVFWYELTVKEFWLAHDAWVKLERARQGLPPENETGGDEPPTADEYQALLDADQKHTEKLKRRASR